MGESFAHKSKLVVYCGHSCKSQLLGMILLWFEGILYMISLVGLVVFYNIAVVKSELILNELTYIVFVVCILLKTNDIVAATICNSGWLLFAVLFIWFKPGIHCDNFFIVCPIIILEYIIYN